MAQGGRRSSERKPRASYVGRLFLIPWHIGNDRDVTLRALDEVRRIHVLVCEDAASTRVRLREDHHIDVGSKRFEQVGFEVDEALLARCLETLRSQDVALLSSSGVPAFVDPGAWLIKRVRAEGGVIVPLAGPSALSTIISMSGLDFSGDPNRFTFLFFHHDRPLEVTGLVRGRPDEAIVVFLARNHFAACIAAITDAAPERSVMAFLDLTKSGRVAGADIVEEQAARVWKRAGFPSRWRGSSDIALLICPEERRRRR